LIGRAADAQDVGWPVESELVLLQARFALLLGRFPTSSEAVKPVIAASGLSADSLLIFHSPDPNLQC